MYTRRIGGAVKEPLSLTAADLAKLPRASVNTKRDGIAVAYNQILLADKADGKPLIGSQGPFRLVAPKERRGARSIRMLTKLDVVVLRK